MLFSRHTHRAHCVLSPHVRVRLSSPGTSIAPVPSGTAPACTRSSSNRRGYPLHPKPLFPIVVLRLQFLDRLAFPGHHGICRDDRRNDARKKRDAADAQTQTVMLIGDHDETL